MSWLQKSVILKLGLTVLVALSIVTISSFIPRHGNYVVHGTEYGDPAHRDVRGIPFVFLKRSLADGECDIKDMQAGICNPEQGNEPHQLMVLYLIADGIFWLVIAASSGYLMTRGRKS